MGAAWKGGAISVRWRAMASQLRTFVGAPSDADSPGTRRCIVRTDQAFEASPERLERALAEAALQLWPDWPDSPKEDVWTREAARLAGTGRLPLPRGHGPRASILRLRKLLGPIRLDVFSDALTEASADGLSRVLEWLRDLVDDFDIQWFVPEAALGLAGVVRLGPESEPVQEPTPASSKGAERAGAAAAVPPSSSPSSGTGWSVRFEPIIGRPHPASPGEILLFDALEASELAGRFRPNCSMDTLPGESFIVDFADQWSPLVVEVDGFRFHSGTQAFARDRHRDFCLLATGHRVLRLTHDEVLASPEKAVDKIRTVLGASWKSLSP